MEQWRVSRAGCTPSSPLEPGPALPLKKGTCTGKSHSATPPDGQLAATARFASGAARIQSESLPLLPRDPLHIPERPRPAGPDSVTMSGRLSEAPAPFWVSAHPCLVSARPVSILQDWLLRVSSLKTEARTGWRSPCSSGPSPVTLHTGHAYVKPSE